MSAARHARPTLAALLLAGASLALAPRGTDAPPPRHAIREHEEARAKRLRLAAGAIQRESTGAAPLHSEGHDRGVDVVSYDLDFTLDPAVRWLEGSAGIRLVGVNPSTSSVALDFDDAYALVGTNRDGKAVTPLSRGDGRLVLPLDPPLRAEERTTLVVAYQGVPPAAGALAFWQHGTGWAATSVAEPFEARTFWPCIDDPADRAVTTVKATVPPGYVVASAGLASETTGPDGKRTFTWRLPQAIPTYLVSLNAAPYETLEDTYVSRDGARTMPIRSYVLPQHKEINRARLLAMKDHIAVLASLFGEYPYLDTKYGIVESSFSGGMEHPTMTSIGTKQLGNADRDLTILLVHELAHDWWGDRVTMKTWDDIWLNEGFATYGEVLYLEKEGGTPPGALLDALYDDGLYGGLLGHAVVVPAGDPFRYTGAVYDKGAWVLHMLRRLVGDGPFFAALQTYGDAHAHGNATREDLRQEYERRTGLDLKQFFDQWVETPFRPVLRFSFQNAPDFSTVTVTVSQVQGHEVVHPAHVASDTPFYRFPLVVRLKLADGSLADRTVTVDAAVKSFVLPNGTGKAVTGLVPDPEHDLLKIVDGVGPG